MSHIVYYSLFLLRKPESSKLLHTSHPLVILLSILFTQPATHLAIHLLVYLRLSTVLLKATPLFTFVSTGLLVSTYSPLYSKFYSAVYLLNYSSITFYLLVFLPSTLCVQLSTHDSVTYLLICSLSICLLNLLFIHLLIY